MRAGPALRRPDSMMSRKLKKAASLPAGLELRLAGGPGALTFAQAARAVDLYAPLSAAGGAITLKEGEPLPDFKLLKKIVAYARKKCPLPGIDVETGGALLAPAKVDFFSAHGADLWLNLDGARGVPGPAARRLRALSGRQIRKVCVAVVFSSGTIGCLPRTMRSLRRYDFKEVLADLELCEVRPGNRLRRLRRVLRSLKESFRRELRSGAARWPQPSRLYGLVAGAGRAGGGPPAAPAQKNGRAVSAIFEDELGSFADIEEVLGELAGNKSFGDLGRKPAQPSGKEIKNLGLEADPGFGGASKTRGISVAREAIDHFLHSPGRDKALSVFMENPAASPGLLRKIAVYSALKSETLKKRLRVSVETCETAERV